MDLKKGNWKLWVQLITRNTAWAASHENFQEWNAHDADKMQDVQLSGFIHRNLWQLEFQVACQANMGLDAHWKRAFFQLSRKSLKLHLFNKLHRVYAAVMRLAPFSLRPGLPGGEGAHYWLVSSWMKTDVVLLACHKSPNQLTYEDTQTDLVSGWGWDSAACVDPAREGPGLECNKLRCSCTLACLRWVNN